MADTQTELEAAQAEAERARESLRIAQDQLLQARKMASLGQLTAGIAHEIKNPLNFVNNFAQLLVDLARELREELGEQRDRPAGEVLDEVGDILDDMTHNAEKIREHGERADATVRSMLMHSRSNDDQRQAVDLNALVKQYVNLAYHGMRASDPHFNTTIEFDLDPEVEHLEIIPQEIGRVFINLANNAFSATRSKAEQKDAAGESFRPVVSVRTSLRGDEVEVRIGDNGTGIPESVRARIFEPFFTTKPVGTGTGLGLSLSYEIVTVGHGGTMAVETEEGEGTTFVITLPQTDQRLPAADG
ncbi:MAG: ATP-binding protein [Bacteroidota bacterium]